MHLVYILANLNRTAPNTVIVNIIKNINANIKVISLGKTDEDSYRDFFRSSEIEVFETKNIFEIIKICKNCTVHLNGYHPLIAGYFLKKIGKCKRIICTCHSNEISETNAFNFTGIKLFKSKIKHFILPILYQSTDLVVAVSDDVKNYLIQIGVIRIKKIYNGINISKQTHISKNKTLSIVQIGHIMPLKNQLFSLKLLKFLLQNQMQIEIKFFGGVRDKKYFDELLEYCAENKLCNNAFFVGNLPFDKLFDEISRAQICIMPSLSEGLPLALLESMSLGLAIMVSNEGGMKELINGGNNGFVFDLYDDTAFERILIYLKSLAFYEHGKNSKEFVLINFDAKFMAIKYLQAYENDY